jgi:hypothetical protein
MAMVEKIDADAVLVTQLASLESKGTVKDMNPQATYNFRPTYYYNVWSVDLEEYVEPQDCHEPRTSEGLRDHCG